MKEHTDVIKYVINEIIDVYENHHPTASGEFDEFFHEVINIIRNTETVKHGKWMPVEPDTRGCTSRFTCSICGGYTTYYEDVYGCDYDYCPNCGAKMDLEE